MRKRKAPIGAVFLLALLLGIVVMINNQTRGGPAGTYDPDAEQAAMEAQQAQQPTPAQPDSARRGAMEEQLKGPVAPR